MKIQEVSKEDGLNCAYLIEFMAKGRWDLSGQEAEKLVLVKKWLMLLGQEMGKQLKSNTSTVIPQPPVKNKKIQKNGSK